MFYIRKLSKKSNLYKIKDVTTNNMVAADVLRQELGTTGNTLSFWKCDRIDNLKDAMKAILLSTTSIETSQFIVIDDAILQQYEIEIDDTEKGVTGYKGFENLHINFCNLNYGKIGSLLDIIKTIAKEKERTPELKREDVKKYIIEVKEAGLLDEDNIRPELKTAIDKYCTHTA